jgi:uncharacterized membrane protein
MTESDADDLSNDSTTAELERLAAVIEEGESSDSLPVNSRSMFQREIYKGIFPHPDLLRAFNDVVPNGAERAFSLTEREQHHRHQIDNRLVQAETDTRYAEIAVLKSESVDRRIVIVSTLIIVTLLLLIAGILVAIDKPIGASAFGAVSVVSALGGAVFASKRTRRRADNDRATENDGPS